MADQDENIFTIPRLRRVYKATYANLPTTGLKAGDLGYATDRLVFYRWSSAAWEAVTIHSSSGLAANIPAAADLPNGSLYFETDTNLLKQIQSGAWATITQESPLELIRKAATESVNNSNVLQNDDEFSFAIGANETWLFIAILNVTYGVADGLKLAWSMPAGGGGRHSLMPRVSDTHNELDTQGADLNVALTAQRKELTTDLIPSYCGFLANGATPGTAQLQWAQLTATVVNTSIHSSSCLLLVKMN